MQAHLSNYKKGQKGEDLASAFLKDQGYKLVCRNFRLKLGEIDIIAKKDKILYFFEVKARKTKDFGDILEQITSPKKRKIRKIAELYLLKYDCRMPCLFGAIGVNFGLNPPQVELVIDDFN